jgi:hypothetical protein
MDDMMDGNFQIGQLRSKYINLGVKRQKRIIKRAIWGFISKSRLEVELKRFNLQSITGQTASSKIGDPKSVSELLEWTEMFGKTSLKLVSISIFLSVGR